VARHELAEGARVAAGGAIDEAAVMGSLAGGIGTPLGRAATAGIHRIVG
jgi:hypothetical protein